MSFDFVAVAPCRNADPWLFDQSNLDLAQPGLKYCQSCLFWEECESLVEPKSNAYDGIVGGKVWRNGRILAKLDPASPHRLVVGEDLVNEETATIRGSELPWDRHGDVFPGGQRRILGGESDSKEDL
jgi:hypothetical protein